MVFFIDLEHSLILNKIVYPSVPVALLVAPFGPLAEGHGLLEAYWDALLGGLMGAGVLLVIYLAARGGFGGGDVKLGGLIGVFLGVPLVFVALPISFIVGGLVGVTSHRVV